MMDNPGMAMTSPTPEYATGSERNWIKVQDLIPLRSILVTTPMFRPETCKPILYRFFFISSFKLEISLIFSGHVGETVVTETLRTNTMKLSQEVLGHIR